MAYAIYVFKEVSLRCKVSFGKNVVEIKENAFKGITKNTTIKVQKSKLKNYKTLFKKKGLDSKVKY